MPGVKKQKVGPQALDLKELLKRSLAHAEKAKHPNVAAAKKKGKKHGRGRTHFAS